MKKTPIILSVVAVVLAACALFFALNGKSLKKADKAEGVEIAAAAGDIVYVQIDKIILGYDMYNDLGGDLEAKKQTIESDINKKGRKLESDMKAFENQINKGLLTRSAAEKQQQSLLMRQQELQNLAAEKQNELMEENNVLMNQVMDAIKTYLESYNEEHQFAAILTTSETTNVVIMGDPALDITDQVLEGLNEEYAKNRNK